MKNNTLWIKTIVSDTNLSTSQKLLAHTLLFHSRIKRGRCTVSQEILATQCNTSTRSIYTWMSVLRALGYITITKTYPKGRLQSVYHFEVPGEYSALPN